MQPRAVVIAQRLQVLEMEAAIQRTTLAATFAEWDQHRMLSWVIGAAKIAGSVLGTPTGKWLLTAVLLRVIRGRFG
jgi:uncharacterized membrane protein YfcA